MCLPLKFGRDIMNMSSDFRQTESIYEYLTNPYF